MLLCQPGQYQLRFGAAPLEFDDGCLSMPPPEKVISIVGMGLAAVLFVPAIATAWTAWQKFNLPVPPAPLPLSLPGLGALAINLFCAFRLARFRTHGGSLTREPARGN